jgi:ATP-dependent exoDNAse (exonuclease V) alpha subunit
MLTHPNTPPHRLDLKVGAICAIQRNMSVENGLVRNARVRINSLHRRFVEVEIPRTGELHCLPRITFSFNPARSSWTVNRKQFPLRPAYATTFNGCQGLTLQRAVLDLRTDSFAHGQLYTALSRVRCRRDIRTLFPQGDKKNATANIVYKHLLL